MTDQGAQIEALWTYEISTEKILQRAVKKGFISQMEADEFSENCLSNWITKRFLGFSRPLLETRCEPRMCGPTPVSL